MGCIGPGFIRLHIREYGGSESALVCDVRHMGLPRCPGTKSPTALHYNPYQTLLTPHKEK